MTPKIAVKHEHNWFVLHSVYSRGDDNRGYAIVRYCDCGARQLGHVERWVPLPRDHDANRAIESGES